MTEARTRDAWHHSASLLALIANCHRDAKKHRPFTPQDFHPSLRKPEPMPSGKDLSVLKAVFIDRSIPKEPHHERPQRPDPEAAR